MSKVLIRTGLATVTAVALAAAPAAAGSHHLPTRQAQIGSICFATPLDVHWSASRSAAAPVPAARTTSIATRAAGASSGRALC